MPNLLLLAEEEINRLNTRPFLDTSQLGYSADFVKMKPKTWGEKNLLRHIFLLFFEVGRWVVYEQLLHQKTQAQVLLEMHPTAAVFLISRAALLPPRPSLVQGGKQHG